MIATDTLRHAISLFSGGLALLDTRQLAALLSYSSPSAVRQAHRRGTLPVPLFKITGRRGLFAKQDDLFTLLQSGMQRAIAPVSLLIKEEDGGA